MHTLRFWFAQGTVADRHSYTCFCVCECDTDVINSKWFNNSCETETEKRGPGYGVRGKEEEKKSGKKE